MARKRYSDEDVLKLLREIEGHLSSGMDVASACRIVGISDATYYTWRKKFGGMGRSQLAEMKALGIKRDGTGEKLTLKAINKLKLIAHEVLESVNSNASVDWQRFPMACTRLFVTVKRILKKYSYPPAP